MSVISKLVDIAKGQLDIYKAAIRKYAPGVDTEGNDVLPKESYTSLESIRTKIKAKNLFDISKLTLTNNEYSEATGNITEIGDRYIVVTTTNVYTGNGYVHTSRKLKEVCPDLIVGETYTLTANTQTNIQTCMYVDTSWYFGKSITITEEMLNAYVCFYGYSAMHGEGYGSCKISDITIVKGTQPGTWSPYNITTLDKLSKIAKNQNGVYDAAVRKYATIKSVSGSDVISITDSADYKPLNLKLYGKSEQKQYEGHQLFDKEKASDSSNWIDSTAIANVKAFPVYVGKGNTVSFKYTQSLTTGLGFYLYISLTNEKRDYFVYHSNDSSLINNDIEFIATEDYIYLLAYESDIPRFMQYIGNDLMINIGSTSLPFEPYTGGEPSPNINYPQPINHAGESGSVVGEVLTGNLFKPNVSVINCTYNGDGIYSVESGKGNILINTDFNSVGVQETRIPNGDVTLSFEVETTNSFTVENVFLCTDGSFRNNYGFGVNKTISNGTIKITNKFKFTNDVTKIGLVIYGNTVEGLKIKNIQLTVGAEDKDYQPYTEQSFTAQTPNGFKGIPLGTTIPTPIANSEIHMSGVYWNEEEQQYYIADTKNENGKDVQRILEFIAPQSGWYLEMSATDHVEFVNYAPMQNSKLVNGVILSTHFRNDKPSVINCGDNRHLYASFPITNGIDTVEKANEFFANNEVKCYGILLEPIITDLTEDELKQYEALRMNQPNTTILNDGGAEMELDYVVKPN